MLKGNDYLLIWLLTEPDGTPIDYNQFESYKVFIQNDSNKSYKYEVVTAALDDGLHFDFKSDMQKSTGYYSLIFEAVKDGRNYKSENYRGIHIDGNVDRNQNVVGPSNSTIKLTDCLSLYLGGRDGRSPYVGVNNHWWVFDDVHKAYVDTGIKVDYSSEIGAQITLAEQAIARVNQTNQAVSENEISRSQNEAVRVQEERTRMANEVERVYDENLRIVNEMKRKEDEAVRISDETTRKDSEATRVNNEATRVSGEDVRVRNEAKRVDDEKVRVANEAKRAEDEVERLSNEASRVTEEGKRVTAETKRQTDTAKAIQDTNTAAQNATDVAAGMEGKIVQIQQNKLDRAEFDLQRQPLYGLGFKSGDNTVNLKVPEINLGLNDFTVEIWTRTEGGNGSHDAWLTGNQAPRESQMKIGNVNEMGTNGLSLSFAFVEGNMTLNKHDSTKNLHHIVITRQGTLVTATINGRLIKSVTQDRVLDFSKFVFDIANTTYFSLGRVFNYAMSQEEAVGLWNGGRVDEVVLDRDYYNNSFFSIKSFGDSDVILEAFTPSNYSFTTNNGVFRIDCINDDTASNKWCNLLLGSSNPYPIKTRYVISFDYKSNKNIAIGHTDASHTIATLNASTDYRRVTVSFISEVRNNIAIKSIAYSKGDYIEVSNLKITKSQCLLELLPQNIHSSGIYNTGSLGSSHNAILSKPEETTFIKEKQYKDKQMSTGAPNFHPIAMGQKVYSDTGLIYEAAIPPTSREWSTADWKQVNNN